MVMPGGRAVDKDSMKNRFLILFAALGFLPGCQIVASRPATPAAAVTREQLEVEPVPADERYFLLLFGSESQPKRAVLTHTWATVVRVPADGGAIESHTISWMPKTLKIRPFAFQVEPGVNLDLPATMKLVAEDQERVTLFGPYVARPSLYRRLLIHKAFLESDAIGYQGFDLIGEAGRKGNGSNCVHAVTDVDPLYGRAGYLLAGNGVHATRYIRNLLVRRGSIESDDKSNHDWLISALGLDITAYNRE